MSSYVEGERVFGPPLGAWDADWVASLARQDDPSLDPAAVQALAEAAWPLLRDRGADALVRALARAVPEAGEAELLAVARATLAYVRAYDVQRPQA